MLRSLVGSEMCIRDRYLVHDECGHTSAPYTLRRLQEYWYWDGMATDTDNFCKSCDTCAKTKPPHRYTKEPLETMQPTAKEFGDRIHIDLLSMPRSSAGHVAICTAVDAATQSVPKNQEMDRRRGKAVRQARHGDEEKEKIYQKRIMETRSPKRKIWSEKVGRRRTSQSAEVVSDPTPNRQQ